jgi:hypothetical protein
LSVRPPSISKLSIGVMVRANRGGAIEVSGPGRQRLALDSRISLVVVVVVVVVVDSAVSTSTSASRHDHAC